MPAKIHCRIAKITALTDTISSFEFESLDPSFDCLEPGAHLDVYLNEGMIRQYSLWDWSDDKHRVSVAVKREDQGKGGSLQMHQLKVGDEIAIDGPRNHFKLNNGAPHYTLIAGGIGVTPIIAMAKALNAQNANIDVYYLIQNESLAAFAPHFAALDLGNNYHLHCSDVEGRIDFNALVKTIPSDSAIYTCGPEPMLNAIIDAVKNHELHYERFTLSTENAAKENHAFDVKIKSTGEVYTVNEDQTILTVLTKNGVSVPSACAAGLCGTCITDVIEGEIDHRDEILSAEEKASNEFMCVCISRAKSAQLTLDI